MSVVQCISLDITKNASNVLMNSSQIPSVEFNRIYLWSTVCVLQGTRDLFSQVPTCRLRVDRFWLLKDSLHWYTLNDSFRKYIQLCQFNNL